MTLPLDRVQGTLDMLILKTLVAGPQHGWAISHQIRDRSEESFQINQGALYPALHRLEHQGLLASDWGTSENNRRAKFYQLTAAGQRRLRQETASWTRLVAAMAAVLAARPGEV